MIIQTKILQKILCRLDGLETSSLGNVVVSGLSDGEVLKYNSTTGNWENGMDEKDKYYKHIQAVASSFWNIPHNLSKKPSVTVTDSSGNIVVGEISYTDNNNLTITFSAALSGYAELN